MYCPNCGAFCDTGCRFCGNCGVSLQAEAPTKIGTHLVPILILIAMSVLGIVLFFAIPMQPLSDTPWFEMSGNQLSFIETDYSGSSELQVPDSISNRDVQFLSPGCFADCDDLTTVILPDSLLAISLSAFEDCDSLRGIFIPQQVSVIDDYAFAGCTDLEAICIPSSVSYISPTAFSGCTALQHIFYDGTYSQWQFLYGRFTGENMNIYCTDGNYCQGIPIP